MREIKFRFWDGKQKIMFNEVTLIGLHYRNDLDPTVYVGKNDFHYSESRMVPRYSDGALMQYTGLKDTNGVEIYEGDQLFATGNLTDELEYVGDVVWDEEDARWETANFHGRFEYIPNGEVVVKGNIYQNPKLSEEAI